MGLAKRLSKCVDARRTVSLRNLPTSMLMYRWLCWSASAAIDNIHDYYDYNSSNTSFMLRDPLRRDVLVSFRSWGELRRHLFSTQLCLQV
jgi:hypothetical protein